MYSIPVTNSPLVPQFKKLNSKQLNIKNYDYENSII